MIKKRRMRRWLSELGQPRISDVFNPWGERNALDLGADGPEARLQRLERHLRSPSARFLMIGEAPGHLGARYSGIPFTSEKLLFEGVIPRLEAQSQQRISSRERPFSEPSATIVWKLLFEFGISDQVVLWNAFPWHPHKTGKPDSNRTPTDRELDLGMVFLDELVAMYDDIHLVAIGQKSERLLSRAGYEYKSVRHPSMGGSSKFRDGLQSMVNEYS